MRSAASLDKESADVLFITALPGFPLVMGPGLKRGHGIPFVSQFQDPSVLTRSQDSASLTKLWAAHGIAALGEPYALTPRRPY